MKQPNRSGGAENRRSGHVCGARLKIDASTTCAPTRHDRRLADVMCPDIGNELLDCRALNQRKTAFPLHREDDLHDAFEFDLHVLRKHLLSRDGPEFIVKF